MTCPDDDCAASGGLHVQLKLYSARSRTGRTMVDSGVCNRRGSSMEVAKFYGALCRNFGSIGVYRDTANL